MYFSLPAGPRSITQWNSECQVFPQDHKDQCDKAPTYNIYTYLTVKGMTKTDVYILDMLDGDRCEYNPICRGQSYALPLLYS